MFPLLCRYWAISYLKNFPAPLDECRTILGPSWNHLGLFWSHLGVILGLSWGCVEPSWANVQSSALDEEAKGAGAILSKFGVWDMPTREKQWRLLS